VVQGMQELSPMGGPPAASEIKGWQRSAFDAEIDSVRNIPFKRKRKERLTGEENLFFEPDDMVCMERNHTFFSIYNLV